MSYYPAIGLEYERYCKEERYKNKEGITLAFIVALLVAMFVSNWMLRIQIWSGLAVLYYLLIN